ncbi:MAG: GNAT family N-acetyltransferase [Bacteroidales bacterium]
MNQRIKEEYITLWRDCFGDEIEFIDEFYNFAINKGYIHKHIIDNKLVGFLHLIPTSLLSNKGLMNGYYLYSVATDPQWRGQGISSNLFHSSIKSLDYSFIVTVPASESLFDFYKKQGFNTIIGKENIEIKKEAILQKSSFNHNIVTLKASRLQDIRSKQLDTILWDDDHMEFMVTQAIKDGAALWCWGNELNSYLWAQQINNKIIILETSESSHTTLPIIELFNYFPSAISAIVTNRIGSGGERVNYASLLCKDDIVINEELFVNLTMDI